MGLFELLKNDLQRRNEEDKVQTELNKMPLESLPKGGLAGGLLNSMKPPESNIKGLASMLGINPTLAKQPEMSNPTGEKLQGVGSMLGNVMVNQDNMARQPEMPSTNGKKLQGLGNMFGGSMPHEPGWHYGEPMKKPDPRMYEILKKGIGKSLPKTGTINPNPTKNPTGRFPQLTNNLKKR